MITFRQITVPTTAPSSSSPTLRSPSIQQQQYYHHHQQQQQQQRIIISVLLPSYPSSTKYSSNNNRGRKTRLKPCAAVLRPDTIATQQQTQQSTDDLPNSIKAKDSGNNGDNSNNNNNNNNNGGDGNSGGSGGNDGGGSSGAPFSKGNNINIFLLLVNGVKDRIKADPDFTYKLLVECGLDAAIILGVNYNLRGEDFLAEIDFTLCQLAISLLSDFALVYLLAPTTAATALAKIGAAGLTSSTNNNNNNTRMKRLKTWVDALPAHVFQKSSTSPFTIGQRTGTFLLKAVQYGSVGSTMGFLGTSAVHVLIRTRELLDPAFSPPTTVQSPQGVAAAWGTFMASSSNVRYNLVNASEDFLYSRGGVVGKVGSVVLRLANNWAGAAQWIVLCNRTTLFNVETPWEPLKEEESGVQKKK